MYVITITERGATPRILKSELNRVTRACLEQVANYWHRHFRAKHFTAAGAREYGYAKRRGEELGQGSKAFWHSYTGRKLRKYGHKRPLVLSGVSEALTLMRDVRVTGKRARVVLHAPALNFRNPYSQINMREEMMRVSEAEARTLTGRAGEVFEALVGRAQDATLARKQLRNRLGQFSGMA
jgi:hypothetical protein